ncbi:protein FAM173B [Pogonomyrmex barbatus]|uniref:Protein FAM173B n=1 Tax=Pogonomyrmex barbatus TaxID=144034 RepID=A0A6I9WQF3_9HYME|nr:protein FAM173B [Pogonomyrmex barbatus]
MELPTEKLENETRKSSKLGLFFVAATGGIATAISVVCFPFVSPAFRKICLPYVPATRQQIKNVIRALNGRSGSLIDLGSGDGRIVLAAAKRGFKAHGIELNTWLVLYSKFQALINGLSKNTMFLKQDLWKCHLGKYDNIVIFGVDQMENRSS